MKGFVQNAQKDCNNSFYLPVWTCGRYNDEEKMAIVFNNLLGETYLFEGPTAALWSVLLRYDYLEPFNLAYVCEVLSCSISDLLSFFSELIDKWIIIDHIPSHEEIISAKKIANRTKCEFLQSSEGIGNYDSIFESADNTFRSKVARHGIPFSTTIELTYSCNEACIHCYNPGSPREGGFDVKKNVSTEELSYADYTRILDSLAKMGVAKVVFTGGEPFMKKDVMGILAYAHKLKFAFSVYTNGQFLSSNPAVYEQLRDLYPQYVGLSLYSTIPEIHDRITRRRGSCARTMAIAEKCYNDALGLQIKCPIMRANKDSYSTVYDFALRLNGMPQFDVNITSGVDGDCYATKHLRLSKEQLEEVLKDKRIPLSIENNVGVIERRPEMMFCGAGDSCLSIKPDGTVNPCCAFPLDCGNAKEQPIEIIWKDSAELKRIRNLQYRDSDICGKKEYCKFCNRCIGQSYIEHGIAENHSSDNCFLAKIRYELANK